MGMTRWACKEKQVGSADQPPTAPLGGGFTPTHGRVLVSH